MKPHRPLRSLWLLLALLVPLLWPQAVRADALSDIHARGELRWGVDLEGGEPYASADAKDPAKIHGFEVDIAHAIAKRLGVRLHFVHNAWDGLIPALERGNFDMAMNGIEITPDRARRVLFSRPYYVYTQQITVRQDNQDIRDLASLAHKRVGTLSGTVAQRLLEAQDNAEVKLYPSNVQPYDDLLLGRLDAVLIDLPIASFYGRRPGLKFAGEPFGQGFYAICFRQSDGAALKAEVDRTIADMLTSGEMEHLLSRYSLWNEAQKGLSTYVPAGADSVKGPGFWQQLRDALPLFAKGTVMTVTVSVLAMGLAIAWGITLATVRLYAPKPLSSLAGLYVEVFRGTPLLVQLFLIYYGLPSIGLQLDAFVAAVVGLGLNYAAYEAENYRAGLLAIPRGQTEAALALGMNRLQALSHVIFPQAARIVIPPVTNDFIALFKDSSVVSIITMVELTKVYGMLASSTYNYVGFGLVTAAIYFAISYPTSLFARWVEQRLRIA